jgi:outer membrane protein assembly factor BamB
MTSFACHQCGAALEVPSPPPSVVRCKYCRAETPVGSLSRGEVDATRIDRALDAHASRSRAAMIGIGIALGCISLVTLAVVLLRGASPAAPALEVTRGEEAKPMAVVAPSIPVPPEPVSPSISPAAPARPVPRVKFGGEGTGEGRFSHVKALAVAADGTVYVGDRTRRIQAFDASGGLSRTLSVSTTRKPTGPLDMDITEIEGLAATRDGKLWVSIGYDLVRIDAMTGEVEHTTQGATGKTCFRDLALSPRGEIHARSACTMTNQYALVHLDAKGKALHRYDDPPDWDQSVSGRVAVDGAGRWYVPYGTLSEVRVLEPDGKVFTRFGQRGQGDGEFESFALDAVALDPTGRVYVRDSDLLAIFTPEGRFLRRFDPGELGSMWTFAIGGDGTIWVLTGKGLVGAFDPPTF